ncbi:Lipoprotein [uncultured Thiomicrorhabdus sp.]
MHTLKSSLVVFFLFAALFLSSCSNNEQKTPQNVVSEYQSALQSLNFTSAYNLLNDANRPATQQIFNDQFQINDDENRLRLTMNEFKIISVNKRENQATVQLQTTTPQIQAFDLLIPEIKANLENKNYAAVEERMHSMIAKKMILLKTESQTFTLSKENNVWLIDSIQ